MNKRVLIVGSSSNVAQSISANLTNNKYGIIGTYNENYPKNPKCYKSLIKIDFLKKSEIRKLDKLSNISDIIFTIGRSECLDQDVAKIGYSCLENLIDYMNKINRNIRIIFCSSSSVYGNNKSKIINERSKKNPSDYYGKYKLKSENLLKKSGIDYIIIRFPIIFGNYFKERFVRFIDAIKNNHIVIFGDGRNNFSFIHQKDISSFILRLIQKKNIRNDDFNLSSGSISQKEYMELVAKVFDKKDTKSISLKKAFELAAKRLEDCRENNTEPTILKENIISLSRDRKYECDKAKQATGWKPIYKIDRIIKDTFG